MGCHSFSRLSFRHFVTPTNIHTHSSYSYSHSSTLITKLPSTSFKLSLSDQTNIASYGCVLEHTPGPLGALLTSLAYIYATGSDWSNLIVCACEGGSRVPVRGNEPYMKLSQYLP